MRTEQDNLNRLKKGENPFHVPEGYFEKLTDNIMCRLPENLPEKEVKVSWMDRMRPWFYMAAVFAGLGLFFKAIVQVDDQAGQPDSLLVKTNVNTMALPLVQESEDEDYLEYLEDLYTGYLLAEKMAESE